jgi:hypothetical protein
MAARRRGLALTLRVLRVIVTPPSRTLWPRHIFLAGTNPVEALGYPWVRCLFITTVTLPNHSSDYNDANLPSHDLRGANLTKIQIQEAVGVLHAAAGDDRTNMKKMKKLVEYCPDATAWLENSAEGAEAARLARKFDELSVTAFVRRLERKQRKANAKSKAEGKKKRKAGSDLDSDALDEDKNDAASTEEEELPKKKSKRA